MFITQKGEIVYSLPKIEEINQKKENFGLLEQQENKISSVLNIQETLLNALPIQNIQGEKEQVTKVNYFKGNKEENWKTNLATFEQVDLGEVYSGIALKLKAYSNNVEKLFFVKPNSDPDQIKLEVKGIDQLTIAEDGRLVLKTTLGEISFTKPIAFQVIDNQKIDIEVAYQLFENNQYGFQLGEYNKDYELIIDPLLASTFLGGSGDDVPGALIIDEDGYVYVVGHTNSTDFPATNGTIDNSYNGGIRDVFVSKFDSDLENLIASTYIGGSLNEAVNLTGNPVVYFENNLYITGETNSVNFPVISGSFDKTHNGNYDDFIFKINKNLNVLLASTYLGGSGHEDGGGTGLSHLPSIFVKDNMVYVSGITWSTNFPTTIGAYNTVSNGNRDVFISKFDLDLQTLIASTYYGGILVDSSNNLIVDDDSVCIVGYTSSTNLPTTPGAYSDSYNGGWGDGHIAVFSKDLTTLKAATYFGGVGGEEINKIILDGDDLILGMYTYSDGFLTNSNSFQKTYGGSGDTYIFKMDKNLTTVKVSTYLGGNATDHPYYMTKDDQNNILVLGVTSSLDFPVTDDGFQAIKENGQYGYMAKLSNDLSELVDASFLGNEDREYITGGAIDKDKNIYIISFAKSDFPTTPRAYDLTFNGGTYDAFIAKFSNLLAPTVALSPLSNTVKEDIGLYNQNIKFTLDGYGSENMIINYKIIDDSAKAGEHYQVVNATGNFTIDSKEKLEMVFTLPIEIINNNQKEDNKTFKIKFNINEGDYGIMNQDNILTITIEDDEVPPAPTIIKEPQQNNLQISGTLLRSTHTQKTNQGFQIEKKRPVCLYGQNKKRIKCVKTSNKGEFAFNNLIPNQTYYLYSSNKRPITYAYYQERKNYYQKKYDNLKKFNKLYTTKKAKTEKRSKKYYCKYQGLEKIIIKEDSINKVKMKLRLR